MACFDCSGFGPLPMSLRQKYLDSWNIYEDIQKYDISVSTMRSYGDTSKSYWQFASGEQRELWRIGLSLHVKRYPTQNWEPPQKN